VTCDDARLALGSLVLGALGAEEAAQVRVHLRSCAACHAEYEELTGMPRLMGLVPIAEATNGPPVVRPGLREEVLRRLAIERGGQRRRRIAWTAAGGVAVAGLAAAIGFGLADGRAVEAPEPSTQVLAATDAASGVWAKVALDGVAWGTRLDIQLSGVTPGETCQLVAVTADGQREVTSTWTVPDVAPDRGYLTVPGATGFTPDVIDTFEVLTGDGRMLLRLDQSDEVTDGPGADASSTGESSTGESSSDAVGRRGAALRDDDRVGY